MTASLPSLPLSLLRAAGAARGRVPLLPSLPLSPALSRQRAVRGRCNQDSGGHNKTRQCNAGRRTTDRPTQPPREKSIRYTRSRPPPPPSSGVGGERGRAHVVGSGNGEKGRKTQEGTNRRREEGEGGETAPSERGWSPPLRRVWQCSAVARPAGRRARWRGG